jgi:uncharacterized RmlC-like cupin family protein
MALPRKRRSIDERRRAPHRAGGADRGGCHPGMVPEQAIQTDGMWAGYVRTAARMVSGWHHDGTYETTIFVLSGSLRMEFGPAGSSLLEAGPGDFVYVAPRAVHRESNPTDVDSAIVVVRSGTGEPVVNVDGPGSA